MRCRPPARRRFLGALGAVVLVAAIAPPGAFALELSGLSVSPRCLPPSGGPTPLRVRVTVSEPARLTIRLQRRLDSPARLLCPRGPRRRPFVPGRFGRTQTFVRTLPAGPGLLTLPVRRREAEAHAATTITPRLGPVQLVAGTYRLTLVAHNEHGTSQVLLRNFIVLRARRSAAR